MNDEMLTLYYYDDGLTEAERRRIETALHDDPELRARYESLREALDSIATPDADPAPSSAHRRWHAAIERAAEPRAVDSAARSAVHFQSFFWGVAVTAALVIGVGIGVSLTTGPAPGDAGSIVAGDGDPRAAFARGLKVHLEQSQQGISRLPESDDAERIMLVLRIIEQNRLFERVAEQSEADDLARVLRAFEPILLRLAADDIAAEDAETLREQLAFELKVMLTKLAESSSEQTHTT